MSIAHEIEDNPLDKILFEYVRYPYKSKYVEFDQGKIEFDHLGKRYRIKVEEIKK